MSDHPSTSFLARGFKRWDQAEFGERLKRTFAARQFAAPGAADAPDPEGEVLESMYSDGFSGCHYDPAEEAAFEQAIVGSGGSLDGKVIADANGLTGSGEGQLVAPIFHTTKYYPGSRPGPAQQRGDCVSHSTKNAIFTLMCCDIASGKPDEVSGKIEGAPEVSAAGVANGVLSTEAIYWMRGYNGDGWTCEAAARVVCESQGLWLRQSYPELDVDLTKYSGSLAGKYGARKPPAEILSAGKKHLVRTATKLKSFEEIRDYLANGYGISSCGGEGFSSSRDENGVSKRSGTWSHAMEVGAADERDIVRQKYSTRGLLLIPNSWANWNRGGTRIMGTNLDIPGGSFWARWEDVQRRTFIAFSGANGFPARTLPPITTGLG